MTWWLIAAHEGRLCVALGHPGDQSDSWNFRLRHAARDMCVELRDVAEQEATAIGLRWHRPVGGLHVSWNN